MHRIYFTKLFTSGILKGLSVNSSVEGSDAMRLYRDWAIGTKGQDVLTRDRWIITDASFQNFSR